MSRRRIFLFRLAVSMAIVIAFFLYSQDERIICKKKKLWSFKQKIDKNLMIKASNYLKAITSPNHKRKEVAINKFRTVVPYILSYIKKLYPFSRNFEQYQWLHRFTLHRHVKISDFNIICEKDGKFMWYALLNKQIIIVGNDKTTINGHALVYDPKEVGNISIGRASCNLSDNSFTKYAIQIDLDFFIKSRYDNSSVITNDRIYRDSTLYTSGNNYNFIIYYRKRGGDDNSVLRRYIIFNEKYYELEGQIMDVVAFSSDGSRFAYKMMSYEKQSNYKYAVVSNSGVSKLYDTIYKMFFSPDGSKLVYVVYSDNKYRVVINDKGGRLYDKVDEYSIVFSSDGKRVAYVAGDNNKKFVVLDGIEQQKYEDVYGIVFSPDGRRFAYIARENGKEFIVLDGKKQKEHDSVPYFIFSFDSKKISYVAKDNNKVFVVMNGEKQKEYNAISNVIFSPDSKRFAYVAYDDDESIVVLDEAEIYRSKEYYVDKMIFSPDSKKLVYVIKEKRIKVTKKKNWGKAVSEYEGKKVLQIVLGDKMSKAYASRYPNYIAFTENSKIFVVGITHNIYKTDILGQERIVSEKDIILLNNDKVKGFYKVSHSVFVNKNKVIFLGIKFNNLYQVECE